ncbi:hypothetical protein [Flectobacillus major]|jgi:hypothetical protein|uniref:hypothetical protein n=1 Tax=Flectobacillus major TaxID=103 RepID=UPI00047DE331|nr:hypothetical protein [Flectobacillus major]
MTTLDYVKMILDKVSFDAKLFEKELRKAIKNIAIEEVKSLKDWCFEQYGKTYERLITRCFNRFRKKTQLITA